MGLLTVNAVSGGRRRSFRMQRRHSPSSVRDGFPEQAATRRGDTGEVTLAPKKKDRKWTLSGLFRRRKNKSSDTENSSSLEENLPDNSNKHKGSFLKRKLSLKKHHSGSRKVVGKFEFSKNVTSNDNHETSLTNNRDSHFTGNSYDKLSSLNSSSLSSKQKFDSLTLLQTGSSCGSLNSSGKRSAKNEVKARVEAEHDKLKDSSSDDEFPHTRKYHSQDNINDSLKRRSRAARTERYLKRLNQINNLPYHQQAELLRMLDRNKINMTNLVLEPQTYLKAQSANSSLTNSPLPNIKFTFCPGAPNNNQNNLYVNLNHSKHHKVTKSFSKPSPILPRQGLRQSDFHNSVNSVDDRHIYMNVASPNVKLESKVPPTPPPRDPHRKVIMTYSSPSCVGYQQRPVSYAFEAPKCTSVDNLPSQSKPLSNLCCGANNQRSNSEQHISNGSVYSPVNDRPASVLQFTSDIDYSPTPVDYQYITDQRPRSRRPIQIECPEEHSSKESNNLKPNSRLYFSDQHINSYRFENGSNPRSVINSSEDQLWKQGDSSRLSDSAVTNAAYNANTATSGNSYIQFNKPNKAEQSHLDCNSEHASSPTAYLSRRNSKEIGQLVRPLSMVLEKSESEVESSKPDLRASNRSNPKSLPPDPPIRKNFSNAGTKRVAFDRSSERIPASPVDPSQGFPMDSVNSVDIDQLLEFNKQNYPSSNLEEALNELEEIYKSLQLSDDDLLDRAERRDVPAQLHAILSRDYESDSSCDEIDGSIAKRRQRTRSLSMDRKKDDMAYRRIVKSDNPNVVPKLDTRNIMSQAGSFLLVSPTLAPPVFPNLSEPPMSPDLTNEPDVTFDDVVFRSIKHVNNSLRTLDPQPPFGIPVGPITQASSSDYLHAIPEDRYKPTFSSRKTPDVVKDDLAFRNLRKDLNQTPCEYRKKRAIRSLSANLSGVLSRAEKLKYSFPHPLSYARSSSYNDLPNECNTKYHPNLEPSISQMYSSASTESLTDFDVSEFLRHKTPSNYEELLRKFNSKFENSTPNGISNQIDQEYDTKASVMGKSEVQELVQAIENNELNKISTNQEKTSQPKVIAPDTRDSVQPKDTKVSNCDPVSVVESKDRFYNSHDYPVNESFENAKDHNDFRDSSRNEFITTSNYSPAYSTESQVGSKRDNRSTNLNDVAKKYEENIKEAPSKTDGPQTDENCNAISGDDGNKSMSKVEKLSSKSSSKRSENLNELRRNIVLSSSISSGKCEKIETSTKSSTTELVSPGLATNEKRTSPEKSERTYLKNQSTPLEDFAAESKNVKSKERSLQSSEKSSKKVFELKTRRHSKIEIPEYFGKNKDDKSVSLSHEKSNADTESMKVSSESPKVKKKRLSKIEIPELFREHEKELSTNEHQMQNSTVNAASELDSKSSRTPKLKKKRSSLTESTDSAKEKKERPSSSASSVKDTVVKNSSDDKKSKTTKSPKLKKKRLSQIESPEKAVDSHEKLKSNDKTAQESKPSTGKCAEPESRSEKSSKKSKRLGQMGVSEKFRKSMEHLASSYATEQEADLKFTSTSSSEGDLAAKASKLSKSKKKRPSQVDLSEKTQSAQECSILSSSQSQAAVSKSNDSNERVCKSKSSRSPSIRRKKVSGENLISIDVIENDATHSERQNVDSDQPKITASERTSESSGHRRKSSGQLEIPEIFRNSNDRINLLEKDKVRSEKHPVDFEPKEIAVSKRTSEDLEHRRKSSGQLEIPEIFRNSNEKLNLSSTLAEVKSGDSSNENVKQPSKISIPEVFQDSCIKAGAKESLTSKTIRDVSCENLKSKEGSKETPSTQINSTATLNISLENAPSIASKINVAPSQKTLPLKSILKKTEFKSVEKKVSTPDATTISEFVEKSGEDSGVIVESLGDAFLSFNDNVEKIETCASNSLDIDQKIIADRPSSHVYRSESICPVQTDTHSIVTELSESQNQTELVNKEIEKILKNYESKVSEAGCAGKPSAVVSSNQHNDVSNSLANEINVLSTENCNENSCCNEPDRREISTIIESFAPLENCSQEPDSNDKDEIVMALSELTSKLSTPALVTASKPESEPLTQSLENRRELDVTSSADPVSSPASKPAHKSPEERNGNSQPLIRRSLKSANQSCFTKSSSSCSDFEGIALSTSSLLAASYCFACLLQSDYLSLVNLMAAIVVIVACFVLYHVLAAE
ncbi:uncharacterized protein Svil isoform X4 [Bemisia tabaci]